MNGCHWYFETEGILTNSHCPALYLNDGFENWTSTTSARSQHKVFLLFFSSFISVVKN